MTVRRYRYLHFDVFARERFGGNQLAVFPDATGLSTELMQSIAREMNFAESTFVLPGESGDGLRMRIFSPAIEMPMAGHPVIGSTFALAREGAIPARCGEWTYQLNIGPLPVELEWQDDELAFVWMTQRNPDEYGPPEDIASVAAAVGLPEASIRATRLPVQRVSCGVPFVIVPLVTRADVDAAEPDARAIRELARVAGQDHYALYVFTTDRMGATDEARVYSRMFAPDMGIYEDPATGSAAGPLGCYLVHHQVISPKDARSVLNLQGRKLGRPSWLHIAIESDNGLVSRVRVGGASVFVSEGTFDV